MANTIKVDGKVISYTTEKSTKVKFSDGTIITMTGSVANSAVLKAYKKEKEVSPPVVIIKPSPGEAKMISYSDFIKLKDVDGERLKVKSTSTQQQARPENISNSFIDLSDVSFSVKDGVAIEMIGFFNDVIINGGFFTGSGYRCVQFKNNLLYDGTEKTVFKNIVLQNLVSDNGGSLFGNDGNIKPGEGVTGAMRGFKLLNCKLSNCPTIGNALYLYAAEDFEVSGNIINNVNTAINNHNGVFGILGNGKLHSNKVTNHQGNLMRAQPMQVLGSGKILEAYNNIAFNSRKYGAFEVQVFDYYKNNGHFKPADVSIHNNTAGNMNLSKDWEGVMLDYYDTYGKLEYYNNLGYAMNRVKDGKNTTQGVTDMINYNAQPTFIRNEGNIYLNTASEAVHDTINFKSKLTGIGAQ